MDVNQNDFEGIDNQNNPNDQNNQKLENVLNLALDTSSELRTKSGNLNVGYEVSENTWELIVKYNGDIRFLEDMGIGVELLINSYAILTVPEPLVDRVADVPEIEYVEKPKRLYFAQMEGIEASCISPVTQRQPFLSGKGVLVAIIDSGERVIIMSS